MEATYGWYWAVDAVLAAKFEVHLAHPYGMKAMRKRKRVKTDARDAPELANLLRLGSLPEAYIAPPDLRELAVNADAGPRRSGTPTSCGMPSQRALARYCSPTLPSTSSRTTSRWPT